jgi:Uma2 family endonuclease
MTWQEVLERKELQDLPFKIELNEHGEVEMSSATNMHGLLQSEISSLLRGFLKTEGMVATESSVQTTQGVKVADVAWISKDFFNQYARVTPFPTSPEICFEIISPSNSTKEILEKIGL